MDSNPTTLKEIVVDRYLSETELLQLPMFAHLKPATLVRWRHERRGPRCTIVGRQPFYRLAEVYQWLRDQEDRTARIDRTGPALVPVSSVKPPAERRWRTGRHKTKADKRLEMEQAGILPRVTE